jgi:dienelactone hydrolase
MTATVVLAALGLGAARAATPRPAFTSWTQTFVDPSRPTTAGAATPAAPQRTLVTTIYVPKGRGPFPLIVFGHGSNGHPDKFTRLLGAWATAGYVVAAPAFPLTNSTVPGNPRNVADVGNQPGDMSFVLSAVLRENRDRQSDLYRAIDRRHVGAAGLSLGGATTYLAVFDGCCRDRRFTSAMVLDGLRLGNALHLDGHVPLLIAHSDTDPTIPYGSAQATYRDAEPPVWLVTLHGASHATQWEDDPTPYDAIDERLTVDFWDATLRGEKGAFARLQRDATVPDLASIESRRAALIRPGG